MGLNKLDTTTFDDLSNQISINILSNHDELFAIWKEKDQVIIKIHYCKHDNELKILEGSLGLTIQGSRLSEEQKVFKCAEALEKVIMTQKSLANIKRNKELIQRNDELIVANQQLIDRVKSS